MGSLKKIGIMGGTFNPIHTGHLILAENAYEQFGLDIVYFMPSKNPPHKDRKNIISDEHRANMVQLAIGDNPHFALSFLEIQRVGITYTVDTLDDLTKKEKDVKYYFIIGADSLFQLETWREPGRILSMAQMVVATRDHVSDEKIIEQIEYLNKTYCTKIELLKVPTIDVSSEHIREAIKDSKSIKYYVTSDVENYIHDHKLYLS